MTRDGSKTQQLLSLIREQGTARSSWLAEQTGLTASTVSGMLNPYQKNGTLLACKVQHAARGTENEYRLSTVGPGSRFTLGVAGGASPAVRSGTVPRESASSFPSGLHLEAAHGRPKEGSTPRDRIIDVAARLTDMSARPAGQDPVTRKTAGDLLDEAVKSAECSPAAAPTVPAAPVASAFRCALASDGALILMRPDAAPIELSPSESRTIVDYLRKLDALSTPADIPALLGVQAQ